MSLTDDVHAEIRDVLRHADAETHAAVRTLADLERHGPPVRIRDLCRLTGFGKDKFYADIERGDLKADYIRTGQTKLAVIERAEAVRHLTAIGFRKAA